MPNCRYGVSPYPLLDLAKVIATASIVQTFHPARVASACDMPGDVTYIGNLQHCRWPRCTGTKVYVTDCHVLEYQVCRQYLLARHYQYFQFESVTALSACMQREIWGTGGGDAGRHTEWQVRTGT